MLTSLFPHTHTRYSSLPVLGDVLEDLCVWLEARGYPPSAICRRMEAAPFLDKRLRRQGIQIIVRLHRSPVARLPPAAEAVDPADRVRPRPLVAEIP